MGTRHMQRVITKSGETKLDNYGQWDGYPEGQGVDILTFLRKIDLDKFNDMVSKLREPIEEDYAIANEHSRVVRAIIDNSTDPTDYNRERDLLKANPLYYGLSRDCGSDIHQLIYDGKIPFGSIDVEGYDHSAYDYVIDLQKRKFIIKNYVGKRIFNLDKLPTEKEFLRRTKKLTE